MKELSVGRHNPDDVMAKNLIKNIDSSSVPASRDKDNHPPTFSFMPYSDSPISLSPAVRGPSGGWALPHPLIHPPRSASEDVQLGLNYSGIKAELIGRVGLGNSFAAGKEQQKAEPSNRPLSVPPLPSKVDRARPTYLTPSLVSGSQLETATAQREAARMLSQREATRLSSQQREAARISSQRTQSRMSSQREENRRYSYAENGYQPAASLPTPVLPFSSYGMTLPSPVLPDLPGRAWALHCPVPLHGRPSPTRSPDTPYSLPLPALPPIHPALLHPSALDRFYFSRLSTSGHRDFHPFPLNLSPVINYSDIKERNDSDRKSSSEDEHIEVEEPIKRRLSLAEEKPKSPKSAEQQEISVIPTSQDSVHPAEVRQREPPPRFQCEACQKSYSTFNGLSKHKEFHCSSYVRKQFSCPHCDGKSYTSLGALKMHIRTHTLPCRCKLCGKAFSRPWLLQGHLRTHTGEKPFDCQHCSRAFADRSNLRAHLQTHCEVKKYDCKLCGKTFSRMSLLLKHKENNCSGNVR